MPQSLKIQNYNPKYLTYIYELCQSSVDMPWTMNELESTIDDLTCYVAEHKNNPCGFIIARNVIDEAEILLLAVSHESRRLGVAKTLLNHYLEKLKASGTRVIFLEVSEFNAAAINFYFKNGFTQIGTRNDYYNLSDGTKARALLLSKEI